MPQNAVRFGAKCKAKWCKTQGEMPLNARQKKHKHPLQLHKQNLLER